MDWSLKPITTTTLWDVHNHIDRLSSLPDELLIRILSLLPTKDAAATCVLSTRMRRVFPWITSLDFDASPISHCLGHSYAIERYPTFVTFIDNVLQSYLSQYLTRFRLRLGMDFHTCYVCGCTVYGCRERCLPDLKFERLNAWISFPLTLCGLRELDLCILVTKPGNAQLPPAIFTCETLEVLKLQFNLGLDRVSTMPSYRLPNLKLLRLCASFVSDDGFLTRLVSSCPVLEDLTFAVFTYQVRHTTVDSPSLLKYSVPVMRSLVKADIYIRYYVLQFTEQRSSSVHQILILFRSLSNVQHLCLHDVLEHLDYVEVKDLLPVFPNLNHLDLGCAEYWDTLLLPFLNCSPVLETLVLNVLLMFRNYGREELEQKFFRRDDAIPSCCRSHLKRIVINEYSGSQREVVLVRFLLRHALVLEELVICRSDKCPSRLSAYNVLNNLPKASITCSIQVV